MTTGIAVSVDAAIRPPQSVFRLVPLKYDSQTVTVCFDWSLSMTLAKMYSFQVVTKHEDRGRDEPGRDERQQDPDERAEPARAVHHRGLLELLRDAEHEPAQRPDGERQDERHVREDHAGAARSVRW